jgi:hypothetical protein
MGEALTASYLMAGDTSNDLQKKAIVAIYKRLAKDEIKACRKSSRKELDLFHKRLLSQDLSKLEGKLGANTLDPVETKSVQDYLYCLKSKDVSLGKREIKAYEVLKWAGSYRPAGYDQKVLIQSFAEVYLKLSNAMETYPAVADFAEKLIDLDQENRFCKNGPERMGLVIKTLAKEVPLSNL